MNEEEARLLSLSLEDFRDVVNADLRRSASDKTADALRSLTVFDRWWGTLIGMSKSVEGQLGSRREEYLAAHAEREGRLYLVRKDLARNKRLDKQDRIEAAEVKESGIVQEIFTLREDYHRSRAASLRFKSGLEEWLAHAAIIRRSRKPTP